MPTGYAAEGLSYNKKLGKWQKKQNEKAFDYDGVDATSSAFAVSFFRFYPDYFADAYRAPDANYTLELPQRVMMRALARYRDSYITGCRGLTKTFCLLLEKMIEGVLFPGEKMRYNAPAQKQAAALATQAFHTIEHDYPALAEMWQLRNDRQDMFRITTIYGSEFTMYSPRGDNCSQTCAEEIAQETPEPFDMDAYETSVLPTCRLTRQVNQKPDRTHIDLKHSHISNASTRQNRAFSKHRAKCLKEMLFGEPYEGIVLDWSWISAMLGNLRDVAYWKDQKASLTAEAWLRECCARYTGSSENPMIDDATLAQSRKNYFAEFKHCGDTEAIYVVAHDVSYENRAHNAMCADVVLKLTTYKNVNKRDKYRKQVVYVDIYSPPATEYQQAQKVKQLWSKFCKDGAQTTYLLIDARAVGKNVVTELMKPSDDGLPTLCCIEHDYAEVEQPNSLPVIYPLKAATRGGKDEEGEMIRYAQREFEQGNVELLTADIREGVEQYKRKHGIFTDADDRRFARPYKMCDELCQQINNLKTEVSGLTLKEKRKSASIQRDAWSACKYALRLAARLEEKLSVETYRAKSSWHEAIENMTANMSAMPTQAGGNQQGDRSRLLGLRHR